MLIQRSKIYPFMQGFGSVIDIMPPKRLLKSKSVLDIEKIDFLAESWNEVGVLFNNALDKYEEESNRTTER